jgi:hypothetical protein
MAIEINKVPIEAHYSIGKIERYYALIKRAYEIVTAELGNSASFENALQMAVKAVNDTAGPDGLVPTLLVFGTFPRVSHNSPPSPSITTRAKAIRRAMAEIRKLKAEQQVTNAFAARNGPNMENVLRLLLQSEIRVFREKRG